jgi:hypothetical protein
MWAILTADSPLVTRPTYSSIRFGLLPAASMRVGFSIRVGIVFLRAWCVCVEAIDELTAGLIQVGLRRFGRPSILTLHCNRCSFGEAGPQPQEATEKFCMRAA